MIKRKYTELEIKETPHKVDVRVMYNKETAQAMHIKLMPNETLKPHLTPVDVFFYVLEGKPTILVGEDRQQVEKDNLVESPANIVHCLSNETDEVCRVLVVKAPKPTKAAKLL